MATKQNQRQEQLKKTHVMYLFDEPDARSAAVAQHLGLSKEAADWLEVEELEVLPRDEWFVEDADGRVHLRIEVTGLLPRRAASFPDKAAALTFLTCFLSRVDDAIKHLPHIQEGVRIVVEDKLASRYRQIGREQRLERRADHGKQ